ncbi:MAG TPA: molybdopterin-dependent oxidoreductase, partial [Anaerolineales bacterium]|nr:molybdopterin-dependent oxidoreductase [Anaerolineales bacterium]
MIKPKISRRDFLKLAGAGAATSAVLTGCGPASRHVVREPYANMPEYTYTGESTYYATTCFECAAGCGLVVRTMQGRALKVEGNPLHPLSQGKTCARGQATLHGLYNPDRVRFPVNQKRAAVSPTTNAQMSWDEAIQIVVDALQESPGEIAFLLGTAPDHLFDLVNDLTSAIGAPAPTRYSALNLFETQATLQAAAEAVYGQPDLLHFDFGNADLVFSFGANFLETWLSPVAFTRQYASLRKGKNERRGYMVQFESRMSQTAAVADEWIPIKPGTEAHVALALGRLIAEAQGTLPEAYADISAEEVAKAANVDVEKLRSLADRFARAERPIAIPGSWAMGQSSGLENAVSILALNSLAGNIGQPGGVFMSAPHALPQPAGQPSVLAQIESLIDKMNAGEVKTLFIHGVNPIFELPQSYGFAEALQNVPLVISFASFPDETALLADYIFPDRTGLESWGYQRVQAGSDRTILSGAQPVVVPLEEPLHDVHATADVLLAAAQEVGGDLAAALPFEDEVAFIQDKLSALLGQENELIQAGDIKTFSAQFQQHGGWWSKEAATSTPETTSLPTLSVPSLQSHG